MIIYRKENESFHYTTVIIQESCLNDKLVPSSLTKQKYFHLGIQFCL